MEVKLGTFELNFPQITKRSTHKTKAPLTLEPNALDS
jgi:hypothetical protein